VGEDFDALLVPADLPSVRLPVLVITDQGRVRALGADEQDVREILAGQPGSEVQAPHPVLLGAERSGGFGQARAQRRESPPLIFLTPPRGPRRSGVVRGHHGPPG
jgi:hypothetical protein